MTDPPPDAASDPAFEGEPLGPVDPASLPSVRRLSDVRYRLFVVLAIGGAIGALVLGYRATQPDGADPVSVAARPDVVERLIPQSGAEVIRQAELGIDLAPGYEGRLVVNGVEIPVEELRLVPEQNEVYFAPGSGKAVEQLQAGPNCVTAIVWESAVGRDPLSDQAFQWCFEAL